MTVVPTATTAVEQAFLRRDDDGTCRVLASSLADADAVSGWTGLVESYLGPVDESGDQAHRSLSYRTFPSGFAAVMCRTSHPDRPGVVDTHALLGLAEQLTATVALLTSQWRGWRTEQPAEERMDRLRVEELDSPETAEQLRSRALADGDLLARSLAWLLQTPQAPLGLIGCPEDRRVALLWGILAVASPKLNGRDWSFSTHEPPESPAGPPGVAFLSVAPDDVGSRTVVDLRRPQAASPQNEYQANALVYRYEYGADPPGLDDAPAVLPVPVPAPPPRAAAPALRPRSLDPLMARLVDATDVRDLDAALAELEHAGAEPDDRGDIRASLERVGWAVPTVHRVVPFSRRDEVVARLVRIAFGPTLSGGRKDARRIVENTESDDVVRALVDLDESGALAQAVTRRWLRQHASRLPDPAAGLGASGRFLVNRGHRVSRRAEVVALTIALVLALLGCFLLGMVVRGAFG
jgi:hypothetical protein